MSRTAAQSRVDEGGAVDQFLWSVCRDGYQWLGEQRDGELTGRQQLGPARSADLLLAPRSPRETTYAPLREFTGLFRTFAELDDREDQILGFANKYGLLGERQGPDTNVTPREPLVLWIAEITQLRAAVATWQYLEAAADSDHLDVPELEELRRARSAAVHAQSGPLLDEGAPRALLLTLLLRDLEAALNPRLSSEVVARLASTSAQKRPLMLTYEPTTLRSALWLQLAHAITEHKQYKRCELCGNWFEIAPGLARRSRLFCSNACRVKAYRQRRTAATS